VDLSRFNLQLQQDQAGLAATQKLLAQGAASPAELAAAQRRVQIDQNNVQGLQSRTEQRYTPADLSSAQAQVADARASVIAAQSAIDNAVIKTPIDGTVYYLPVSQYEYVDTGSKLIDVADLTRMRIAAYFDEPDIGTLAVGQSVAITWEARLGMIWHGHIVQTPTAIQQYQNRFIGEAVITVDDADGVLQPDANVNLTVTIAQHPHVLAVPREALHFDGSQPFVFRIQNGKLARTNVRIGLVNLTEVEIDSGLTEGETVVLNATTNSELNSGESVTAIP
jgi:HlyD family secretion protein